MAPNLSTVSACRMSAQLCCALFFPLQTKILECRKTNKSCSLQYYAAATHCQQSCQNVSFLPRKAIKCVHEGSPFSVELAILRALVTYKWIFYINKARKQFTQLTSSVHACSHFNANLPLFILLNQHTNQHRLILRNSYFFIFCGVSQYFIFWVTKMWTIQKTMFSILETHFLCSNIDHLPLFLKYLIFLQVPFTILPQLHLCHTSDVLLYSSKFHSSQHNSFLYKCVIPFIIWSLWEPWYKWQMSSDNLKSCHWRTLVAQ